MVSILAVLTCFAMYFAGYLFYSRYLAQKVFALRADAVTPANSLRDGIDYVPTPPLVLFGHHYASITGLSPMLGPAIAVVWGWLPAMLWVVFGSILIGCVHDFGALVISVRAKGLSIGAIAEGLMGKRAKALMHAIIFFAIALAMGVFAYVVGLLFSADYYPESVVPSGAILVAALLIGWLVRKRGRKLTPLISVAFVVILIVVIASPHLPVRWASSEGWTWILLAYAWLASVLPVWSLLQPRDFLNSLLLYVGLGLTYIGFFILRPEFASPVVDTHPPGAPPMYPFVFIVIACGAASGFHSLVSSGTTAKQLDREPQARPIGYGAMIGESLLGLAAVLACTAGFVSPAAWKHHYADWASIQGLGSSMSAFIEGATRFVSVVGLPEQTARTLIAVVVVSFALTTLDSATRLLRYNIEEIATSIKFAPAAEPLSLVDAGRHRDLLLRLLSNRGPVGRSGAVAALRFHQSAACRARPAHGLALSPRTQAPCPALSRADGLHDGHDSHRHGHQAAVILAGRQHHPPDRWRRHFDHCRVAGGRGGVRDSALYPHSPGSRARYRPPRVVNSGAISKVARSKISCPTSPPAGEI